jgi:hypothetical protein
MKAKNTEPEKKIVVTIKAGTQKETLDTWRYWEIVGALQWCGADRQTAYDTAKVLTRAKPGDRWEIQPGITLEVKEK